MAFVKRIADIEVFRWPGLRKLKYGEIRRTSEAVKQALHGAVNRRKSRETFSFRGRDGYLTYILCGYPTISLADDYT